MTPQQLQGYLDVMRASRLKAARVRFADGSELAVDFEAEPEPWVVPQDPEPTPGGWK